MDADAFIIPEPASVMEFPSSPRGHGHGEPAAGLDLQGLGSGDGDSREERKVSISFDVGEAKMQGPYGRTNTNTSTSTDLPGGTVFPAGGSVDSSVILQQHYADMHVQRDMGTKQWVFPQSAVTFPQASEGPAKCLGRGTFGEVYVGRWKHIDVACKKLNSAQAALRTQRVTVTGHEAAAGAPHLGQMVADIKAQKSDAYANRVHLTELEALTRLRHPNLVLFLGICHAEGDRTLPVMVRACVWRIVLTCVCVCARVCFLFPHSR